METQTGDRMSSNLVVDHFRMETAGQDHFSGIENYEKPVKSADVCIEPDAEALEDSFTSLPTWAAVIFAILNIIIFILSFCGNIGALVILCKSKITSSRMHFISLALFDLILSCLSPTVDLSQLLARYGGWVFGSFLCKVIPFFQTVAVMGVAFCLAVIAIERYLSVMRAVSSSSSGNSGRKEYVLGLATAVMIWVLAIGFALPTLWYYKSTSFWTYIELNGTFIRPRNETCQTYHICLRTEFDMRSISYYGVLGGIFVILTVSFTYCYVSILVFVKKHFESRQRKLGNLSNQVMRNYKTLKIILALILLYLICRVPVWTYVVVTNSVKLDVNHLTLFLFYGLHLLSNVNIVVNPFAYAICNDSVRNSNGTSRSKIFSSWNPSRFFSKSTMTTNDTSRVTFPDVSLKKYDFTKHAKSIPTVSTKKFSKIGSNDLFESNPSVYF